MKFKLPVVSQWRIRFMQLNLLSILPLTLGKGKDVFGIICFELLLLDPGKIKYTSLRQEETI